MYRRIIVMPKLWLFIFSVSASGLLSCNKDDDKPKDQYTLAATADGVQETPSVETSGSGTMSGTYNSTTNALTYTVTWKDLSGPAIDMHFHGPADPGTPAGVAVAIDGFTEGPAGTFSGSATLNETQETELLGGKWYYNVHTDLHKGGEIRGQITTK